MLPILLFCLHFNTEYCVYWAPPSVNFYPFETLSFTVFVCVRMWLEPLTELIQLLLFKKVTQFLNTPRICKYTLVLDFPSM